MQFSSSWQKCPLGNWTEVVRLKKKKSSSHVSLYTSEISQLFKYDSMQRKTQLNISTVVCFGRCHSLNLSDFLKLNFNLFLKKIIHLYIEYLTPNPGDTASDSIPSSLSAYFGRKPYSSKSVISKYGERWHPIDYSRQSFSSAGPLDPSSGKENQESMNKNK